MKEQILAHIEKVALAICVALSAFFLYGALTQSTYNRTPDDFKKAASLARNNVNSTKVDTKKLELPDYNKESKALTGPIDPDRFGFPRAWRRAFDFGQTFRKEPKILKPGSPLAEPNRGVALVYKVGVDGRLLTRKVKRKDAIHSVENPEGGPKKGGLNFGVAPDGGRAAAAPAARGPGRGFAGPGEGRILTIEALRKAGIGDEDFDPAELLFNEIKPPELAENVEKKADVRDPGQRAPLAPLGRRRNEPREKPQAPKDAKDAKKEDELVDEYVVGLEPVYFVEVVAPFPHADQIREYVKSLREKASEVGLFYAAAECERAELTDSVDADGKPIWTEFKRIDIGKQVDLVLRCVDGTVDDVQHAHVAAPGLTMGVPNFLEVDRKTLTTLNEITSAPLAVYSEEEMDPLKAMKKVEEGKTRRRRGAAPKVAANPALKNNEVVALIGEQGRFGSQNLAGGPDNRYRIDKAMLRVVDLTVQPGRRYKYRVRAKTHNPNFTRSDVAMADLSVTKYLRGPWSDESNEVYVEPMVNWYAGMDSGKRGQVEVHSWIADAGAWAVATFPALPGRLVGVGPLSKSPIVEVYEPQQDTWTPKEVGKRNEFDAETILLDVTPGRRSLTSGQSPKTVVAPIEIVAVNQFGDLIRHDSAADDLLENRKIIVDEYNKRVEASKPAEETEEEEDAKPKKTRRPRN